MVLSVLMHKTQLLNCSCTSKNYSSGTIFYVAQCTLYTVYELMIENEGLSAKISSIVNTPNAALVSIKMSTVCNFMYHMFWLGSKSLHHSIAQKNLLYGKFGDFQRGLSLSNRRNTIWTGCIK